MEQEQDSANTKRIVAAVATTTPVWLPQEAAATTRKSGESPSWPSRLWNNLGISVCKRRKREREVDQDDDIEEGFGGFEAGLMLKSGIRNQKRRINTH